MKIKVDLKNYADKEKEDGIRINKYLSDLGILSRRETDKLISQNLIHLNDRVAILGNKVQEGDTLVINQETNKFKYFLYYKSRGEETAYKLIDKLRYEPIGRLDKESEGLLIYSNDFRIIEALLNPKNKREREYEVSIRENTTPRIKTILERGIQTQETTYAPVLLVKFSKENKNKLTLILNEGKKHEIRRMLNALNLTILSLKRVRFLFLKLTQMRPGQIRELTSAEITKLLETLNLK